MPTTANTINYYVAADGTLRDGPQGSIPQQPRINYGTEYAVTLFFPPSTIAEGDQLQVALNRTRTFFSSASATGDAPVAAVAKHDVTAEEAAAQAVTLTLSTNTRAMIDQVNGIDHPVLGFFGVHVLRGQSFVTLAVADALMMSLESGPDAISPSLPVVDYPTREEAEALAERSETAAGRAETAQGKAEEAQGKAETAEDNAQIWAEGTDQQVEELGGEHSAKEYGRLAGVSATNAGQSATNAGQSATQAGQANEAAQTAQLNASKIAEGSDADVAPLGLEHSAKGWAQEAAATLASKRDILQTLVTSSATSLEVEAGKSYNWTVSAASTISMKAADKVAGKETRIDIYIDLQSGGSVTGDGVTVADAVLQSGWYKLIWDGTNAKLYSTKAGGAASVITIPAATTAYTLQDNKNYQQVPSAVPTYTLPTATMDGLVHEITVLVDFLHVTSCSFVDASGVPVTLQSAISPQIGEAYVFRCYWYEKWRVVPLKIRNAATASSATGVVSVSDAVAGDALSLKMVAPRSVVVNQLFNKDTYNNSTTLYGVIVTLDKTTGKVSVQTESSQASFYYPITVSNQVTNYYIVGHKYIFKGIPEIRTSVSPNGTALIAGSNGVVFTAETANTKIYCTMTVWNSGLTIDVEGYPMMVDLTAYFNGDQTLIDSITSWDDLVAYDPRFANYVEYNTGTVEGVQPTVKVTGKNLMDPSIFTAHGGVLQEDGSYYFATPSSMYNQVMLANKTRKPEQVAISGQYKYESTNQYSGVIFYCYYTDGTYDSVWSQTSEIGVCHTVNFVSNASKTVRIIRCTYGSGSTKTWLKDIQIEWGSTATSYEPYHDGGTATSPVPLYGVGTAADSYDAVTGKTRHKTRSISLPSTGWVTYVFSVWKGFNCVNVLPVAENRPFYISSNSTISSILTGTHSPNNIVHAWLGVNGTTTVFVVWNENVTPPSAWLTDGEPDVSKFMTWLASNPVNICYATGTPTEENLASSTISLQTGNNVALQTDGGRTLAKLAMTYENLPTD